MTGRRKCPPERKIDRKLHEPGRHAHPKRERHDDPHSQHQHRTSTSFPWRGGPWSASRRPSRSRCGHTHEPARGENQAGYADHAKSRGFPWPRFRAARAGLPARLSCSGRLSSVKSMTALTRLGLPDDEREPADDQDREPERARRARSRRSPRRSRDSGRRRTPAPSARAAHGLPVALPSSRAIVASYPASRPGTGVCVADRTGMPARVRSLTGPLSRHRASEHPRGGTPQGSVSRRAHRQEIATGTQPRSSGWTRNGPSTTTRRRPDPVQSIRPTGRPRPDSRSRPRPDREAERLLLIRYHELGDLGTRDELVHRLMPLARHLARRYSTWRSRSTTSCRSRASASSRRRPAPGGAASGHELRHPDDPRRAQTSLPRQGLGRADPERGLQQLVASVAAATDELTARLQRSPTAREVAAELAAASRAGTRGIRRDHGLQAPASLDVPAPLGAASRRDARRPSRDDGERSGFELTASRDSLREAWDSLPEAQAEAVRLRLTENLSQRESVLESAARRCRSAPSSASCANSAATSS